ncbi:MAG: non-canonical purine NTP pyrophosphatase [Phycisphaerae bacterium]|nr:MAG: non-canonical purine NTP pyrophosphatase [Phycisphaerae bacterium]
MPEIVVATGNPHKVEEIRAIFARERVEGVRLVGLDEVPGGPFGEPEETGKTFEDNATIKAMTYAKATGRLCLADDSGLEVDALGGRPGVISSHYCTDGYASELSREDRDRRNNERVLRELDGVVFGRRAARFVCVMVLAHPARGRLKTTRGVFEGRIGEPGEVPRGANGFGYDPLFLLPPDFARTSAEMTADEKNAKSHRGAAAKAMAAWLRGAKL